MNQEQPRRATLNDLPELTQLENLCFSSDRLSSRSFRYFLTRSQAEIWITGEPIAAYGLVLFHRGTSLARIYSLAVNPAARGQGLGRKIMDALEESARQHNALFIRLEVAVDNQSALQLYLSMGYEAIRKLHHYYESGHDGIRMEKRLQIAKPKPAHLPYYAQTTDFTCGPAAMLMAARNVNPNQPYNQIEELNIWREATTIFMTTGHGGTSPFGLALAARRRGYRARLWVSHQDAPFLDSVRNAEKKSVIELIHQEFIRQTTQQKIKIEKFPKGIQAIRNALRKGEQIILLISTYRLNRNKEPHWIWLVNMDDTYAYINDPEVDDKEWKTPVDAIYVPVPLTEFSKMIRYGRNQYRAALLISAA